MPVKALVLITVVATSVVGAGYLLSSENTGDFLWFNNLVSSHSTAPPPMTPAASKTPGASPAMPKPPSNNPLGFMLTNVAEQYSESVRYPSWSVPLTPAQARGYQGNQYEPVDLPLGNGGHFTVTLEKFRFTRGQPILVVASLQGPQVVGDTLKATLEHPESRDAVRTATLASEDNGGYYEGTLSSDEEPGEYRLIVEASVDGDTVRHASTLTIEPYLGEFEGLGDTYIANNSLVIPVHFSPENAGFYALSAQLYEGQKPIALLQAEQRLDMGSDTLKLRAHGTVLADHKVRGKLSVRYLQLRQLPARPGDRTHYAYGPDGGYSFSPPDLDALHDSPVADPESEQRAALLKQLADKF
jgi:hypothetical protein